MLYMDRDRYRLSGCPGIRHDLHSGKARERITHTRHGTCPAMAGSARIAAERFGSGGWRDLMTSMAVR